MTTRTATGPTTDLTVGPIMKPGLLDVGDVELWVEQRGEGPDVLLIAGLSDPAEAWTPQLDGLADRYRLTAFDNRGAGRRRCPRTDSQWPAWPTTPPQLLRALGVSSAPRRRVLGRQRHRPGARAAPSRAGPQPRARQHVGPPGCVLPHAHGRVDAGSPERARASGRCSRRSSSGSTRPARTTTGTVDQIIDEALSSRTRSRRRRSCASSRRGWPRHVRPPAPRSPCRRSSSRASSTSRRRRATAGSSPSASPAPSSSCSPGEAHQPFQERPEPSTRWSTPSGRLSL